MIRIPFTIQLLCSFILGGIAVFSYSPFDIWFIVFLSFSGLLLLISNKNIRQSALIGLFWGCGYFLSGVHWVYISIKQYGELPTVVAVLILALFIVYLSLYPMLFAILLRLNFFKRLAPAYSIKQLAFLAPLIWQITEFIRGSFLNGFSWLQFGYSQFYSPMRGLFPLVGINGVSLLFTCLCGLLVYLSYQIFIKLKTKQALKLTHFFCSLFALLFIFFAPLLIANIQWTQIDSSRQTNVSLVQGNIAQSIRWNSEQLKKTLSTYLALTKPLLKESDIVIWSEASITDLELNQQHYLKELDLLATKNNSAVVLGIIDLRRNYDSNNDSSYDIYNSLIVLGDTNPYQYPTDNRYNKHHLVPFGEYIPLSTILKPIANLLNIPMSSMSAGEAVQPPLNIKGFKFLTVICYEAILSNLVLQNFNADVDFLLTVSNDAWFGNSIGPWQHLQMAQVRALEFGRTMIRSTNNGVTAIVDPNGIITHKIPQFESTALSVTLQPHTGLTPYAKWGNMPFLLSLLILFLSLFIKKPHK